MPTMKEKVAKNYEDYPLEERTHTVNLELEGEDYTRIEQCAKDNDISMEELIFMALIEKLNNRYYPFSDHDPGFTKEDEPFLDDYDYDQGPFQIDEDD